MKLTSQEWISMRQPQTYFIQTVGERFIDENGMCPVTSIAIDNAMSPIHAKAIQTLKDCVKTHISQLYE